MMLREEEVYKELSNIRSTYSEFDYNFYIERFRYLSNDCNDDKEVARLCYLFDKREAFELMLLAIIGNKETEKYFKLFIEENEFNEKNEDLIFDCIMGLIALNVDEGFELVGLLLKDKRHYFDVYDILKFIDNPRANKMKQDMLDGEYGEKAKKYAKYYTNSINKEIK